MPALLVWFPVCSGCSFYLFSYCTFNYSNEFFEYHVSHGIQISSVLRSTALYICKLYIVVCSKSIYLWGLVYSIVGSTSALRNLFSEAVGSNPAEKSKTYQFNLLTLAHLLGIGYSEYVRIGAQGMCKWTACLHPEPCLSTLPVMRKWTACLHPETCCLSTLRVPAVPGMCKERHASIQRHVSPH